MKHSPRTYRAAFLTSLACCAALTIACSDDGEPLPPVISAGAGGSANAGGTSSGGGAAGTGGTTSAGGATTTAGAGGMPMVAVPFEPVILFPFNSGAADTYGWTVTPAGAGSLALIDEDRDPASTTRGALRVNAVFPPYDATGTSAPVTALYEYGDPTTDTNRTFVGATRVHMWIRLVSPTPAASLAFFQPFVQGGAMTFYSNNFGYALADVLADNAWHEFVLEVAGAAYITDLWRVGVALAPVTVLPLLPDAGADAAAVPEPVVLDAGADAGVGPLGSPAPVTIDVDYVWIE